MAGRVDMPTSWELPGATKQLVMQDERNYERSTPDWAATFPRDMSLADDGSSPFIKQVQTFMKGGPLGTFKYTGPVDGKVTDHLLYTVMQFGWKLRDQKGKTVQMISGKTISPSKWQEAMRILKGEEKPKEEEEDEKDPSSRMASFQKYFKANGMYDGSTEGSPTEEELASLGSAAKKIEGTLAKAVKNDEVVGKLWDDGSKTFKTTVGDLKMALKTVVQHATKKKKDEEKVARLTKNDRFLILSYLNARKS